VHGWPIEASVPPPLAGGVRSGQRRTRTGAVVRAGHNGGGSDLRDGNGPGKRATTPKASGSAGSRSAAGPDAPSGRPWIVGFEPWSTPTSARPTACFKTLGFWRFGGNGRSNWFDATARGRTQSTWRHRLIRGGALPDASLGTRATSRPWYKNQGVRRRSDQTRINVVAGGNPVEGAAATLTAPRRRTPTLELILALGGGLPNPEQRAPPTGGVGGLGFHAETGHHRRTSVFIKRQVSPSRAATGGVFTPADDLVHGSQGEEGHLGTHHKHRPGLGTTT